MMCRLLVATAFVLSQSCASAFVAIHPRHSLQPAAAAVSESTVVLKSSVQNSETTGKTPRRIQKRPPNFGGTGVPGPAAAAKDEGKDSSESYKRPDFLSKPPFSDEPPPFPELGSDGIYHIVNEEQHINFLEANADKIIVMKFFAPWCRACKGLAPKFVAIANNDKYEDLPITWASFSVAGNKNYVKGLGILALPSMVFYAGSDGMVENFPCGPSKVSILKSKLVNIVNQRIDPVTRELILGADDVDCSTEEMKETEPCRQLAIETSPDLKYSIAGVKVDDAEMNYLRKDIPYFKDLSDDEFNALLKKAKIYTFDPGAVIMRQGKPGRTFYVIESGEVEISVLCAFEDPLTTPSSYLGPVVNTLKKNSYFGERSLITGEPRAASIRASERTRCFAFDIDDIPESSVLSGKAGQATDERMAEVNDKYGVDVYDIDLIKDQFKSANVASQKRGSVNHPKPIAGVDTEEELAVMDTDITQQEDTLAPVAPVAPMVPTVNENDEVILNLLQRFQLIRHAARCFDYIMSTKPVWGDKGEMRRRSILVTRLTGFQRAEFTDVFKIIDQSGDGSISLLELRRALESIGNEKSDEDLIDIINKADLDGNKEISYTEFMGVMAEAEFFYLFNDTFTSLDVNNTGYVRAGDLDAVLQGVRDLISDDRNSIIDVEDKDMLIDYEHFSRMLLGSQLV